MRIVSLTCSNTEIVCALGCGGQLVGVDADSDHPPAVVADLPRVGRDLDVDAAAVAALEPDLVLASLTVPGHEAVVARLAAEGLPMLVLAPTSVAHTARDIRWVGRLLGVPDRGEAVAATLEQAVQRPTGAAAGPRVLVEWWAKPVIAAGRRSWVDDMLAAAGARNALGERDCESTPLTDAEVVALDPEVVIISWCGVPRSHYRPEVVTRRPAWQGVSAVRHGRVYCVSEAYLGRPGPRLVEGVARLRRIVAEVGAPGPAAR